MNSQGAEKGKGDDREEDMGGEWGWKRRQGYPRMRDVDAVLITGSRMFCLDSLCVTCLPACDFSLACDDSDITFLEGILEPRTADAQPLYLNRRPLTKGRPRTQGSTPSTTTPGSSDWSTS